LKSVFCLSFDFELLLGYHDLSEKIYSKKKRNMQDVRRRIYDLINLLEKYDLKCTWAVVSHLFLDACSNHMDYHDKKWLVRDPNTDINTDPLWYGRDIVKRLLQNPNFEIACHSFSHALFDRINEEQARYELSKSEQLARELGITLRSFVFPRNKVGHKKLLKEFRYITYRSEHTSAKKFSRFIDYIFPTDFRADIYSPKLVIPYVDEYGLVNIPSSMCLYNSGILRFVSSVSPRNYFQWKIRKGLEKLISEGGVLHFFTHPHDFDRVLPKKDFQYLLELIQKYSVEGKLQVLTMEEIADLWLREYSEGGRK
jgi:peptidoglycan/xylan/chitin deacetylase (PgdA/CDA1 family)